MPRQGLRTAKDPRLITGSVWDSTTTISWGSFDRPSAAQDDSVDGGVDGS
jgi:hypothetical protein